MNYTKEEIIVMPVMFVFLLLVAFVLGFLLKNKSEKTRRIPITILTILLLALEVFKQVYSVANGSWSYWRLPTHFCSLIMYTLFLATFFKNETIKNVGILTSFVCALTITICFYYCPTDIIGNACKNPFANFYSFHTFVYHFLVVLCWMLILSLKLIKISWKEIKISVCTMICLFCMIISSAYIFNTNFSNVLTSNISFMENLRQTHGQTVYTIVLFLIGIGALFLEMLICLIIKNKILKRGTNE